MTDPVQAQIFALMPWVLMFVMAKFAAGLQLYWVDQQLPDHRAAEVALQPPPGVEGHPRKASEREAEQEERPASCSPGRSTFLKSAPSSIPTRSELPESPLPAAPTSANPRCSTA